MQTLYECLQQHGWMLMSGFTVVEYQAEPTRLKASLFSLLYREVKIVGDHVRMNLQHVSSSQSSIQVMLVVCWNAETNHIIYLFTY